MNKRRLRVHLPVWAMYVAAAIGQGILPRSPITTEQIKMLSIRSVAEIGEVERLFGFTPKPLKGNIDFVKSVGFLDSIQMLFGAMPGHIRDH